INVSTISAVAAECTSSKEFCARWAAVQREPADAVSKQKTCRAYAAAFYESVTLRQMATQRVDGRFSLLSIPSSTRSTNAPCLLSRRRPDSFGPNGAEDARRPLGINWIGGLGPPQTADQQTIIDRNTLRLHSRLVRPDNG